MSGTIEDFIQHFTGQQTPSPQDASHYLDRFASDHPQDADFDKNAMAAGASQYMAKLPDQDFKQAAQNAYATATPVQQQGLVGSLMRALQNRGANLGGLSGLLGQLSGGSPNQFNADQYAQMSNVARQQHPEAMQDCVREQPWLVKAMGNPVLLGALAMAAGHLMGNRGTVAQSATGGLLGKLFS